MCETKMSNELKFPTADDIRMARARKRYDAFTNAFLTAILADSESSVTLTKEPKGVSIMFNMNDDMWAMIRKAFTDMKYTVTEEQGHIRVTAPADQ